MLFFEDWLRNIGFSFFQLQLKKVGFDSLGVESYRRSTTWRLEIIRGKRVISSWSPVMKCLVFVYKTTCNDEHLTRDKCWGKTAQGTGRGKKAAARRGSRYEEEDQKEEEETCREWEATKRIIRHCSIKHIQQLKLWVAPCSAQCHALELLKNEVIPLYDADHQLT